MKKHHVLGVVVVIGLLNGLVLAQGAPAPAGGRRGRGPATAPSATMPVIQNRTDARHQQFVDRAKQGNIDLLFLGDSITDFWRADLPRRGGKPVWDKTFAPLNAEDFGINADRTQNLLFRLQNGELEGFKAKCIVLMIGTNNLSVPGNVRNTVEDTIKGIRLVVDEIRKRQPQAKLLLLGIFPRGQSPNDPYRPEIKTVNTELAKWDDGKNIFFMDIGDKFLNPDGTISPEIMDGYLHPSEKGYQIWADAILPKVKELMAME